MHEPIIPEEKIPELIRPLEYNITLKLIEFFDAEKMYMDMFGSKEKIELLNRTASHTFGHFQRSMIAMLGLHLGHLLDKEGKGSPKYSIFSLEKWELLPDDVRSAIKKLKPFHKEFQKWRSNNFVHVNNRDNKVMVMEYPNIAFFREKALAIEEIHNMLRAHCGANQMMCSFIIPPLESSHLLFERLKFTDSKKCEIYSHGKIIPMSYRMGGLENMFYPQDPESFVRAYRHDGTILEYKKIR